MQELTTPFEQHDLVWAKIENYPWWPGEVIFLEISQIIEIFEQKKSLFFKISFFADPTYCYLKEDAIIPFQNFRKQLNANYSIDGQLTKAIDLANNAFLRKLQKNTQACNRLQITNSLFNSQSEMEEQHNEKQVDQFDQSTIHLEFSQNQVKESNPQQTISEFQCLLAKYKLESIPNIPKNSIEIEKTVTNQIDFLSCDSQSEDPNQDFSIKKVPKIKTSRVRAFKRILTKRRKIKTLTQQERKIRFMKKLCSFFIEKEFDSGFSRQITLQVIAKIEELKFKNYSISTKQEYDQDKSFLKYFETLNKIDSSMTQEQKLIGIFNSIEQTFYSNGKHCKYEQEKTQIPFVHQEMEDIC